MRNYLLGLVTTPVLVAVVWYALVWVSSVQSWRRGVGGRGMVHKCEALWPNEGWGAVEHPHYWPDMVPWWFIRRVEPLRVRRCLAKPEYR